MTTVDGAPSRKLSVNALAEVSFALRAADARDAKPMAHLVFGASVKADFEFESGALAGCAGGPQGAQDETAMQGSGALRPKSRDEPCLHPAGFRVARKKY